VRSGGSVPQFPFGPVEKRLHLVVDCCVADTLFATQFWLPSLLLIRRVDLRAAALCHMIIYHSLSQ
jgi:hypothetical protein